MFTNLTFESSQWQGSVTPPQRQHMVATFSPTGRCSLASLCANRLIRASTGHRQLRVKVRASIQCLPAVRPGRFQWMCDLALKRPSNQPRLCRRFSSPLRLRRLGVRTRDSLLPGLHAAPVCQPAAGQPQSRPARAAGESQRAQVRHLQHSRQVKCLHISPFIAARSLARGQFTQKARLKRSSPKRFRCSEEKRTKKKKKKKIWQSATQAGSLALLFMPTLLILEMAARCRRKLPESHWHHVLRRQTRWQDRPIKSQQRVGNTFPLAEDYANKLLPTGPCGMPPSPEPSLPCAAVGTASQIGRLMTATDVSDRTNAGTAALRLLLLLFFSLLFHGLCLCVLPKGEFIPLSASQTGCASCRDCFSATGSLARRLCLCVCVSAKGQPVGGNTFQQMSNSRDSHKLNKMILRSTT